MCGFAGKLAPSAHAPIDQGLLQRMAHVLAHRGPDGEGFYIGEGVGFAHRRLSIVDIATGQQPLANEDGTVWVAFNGEIYNFASLRVILEGRGLRFRTHSDTEVIVHSYEEWGDHCVDRFRGMRILWLNASLLLPLDKGGRLRTWHLMRHLAQRHSITYLSFADPQLPAAQRDGMCAS